MLLNRLPTISRPLVDWSRTVLCRSFYSLMERATFAGQKKMLADARHCTLPGSPISMAIQVVMFLISLPSALRTSAINRQLVDNQSVNNDLKFIGNSEVLVASGCQR